MIKRTLVVTSLFSLALLTGCQNNTEEQILSSHESQVHQRSYQSRAYDTTDKTKVMRCIISTLQDLGFVIEKADETLGSVSGTKFVQNSPLRMSVMVRPKGQQQSIVRANAQYQTSTLDDPLAYQDFFNALSKSMFLTAHEVD
jgi:hypothetical protein